MEKIIKKRKEEYEIFLVELPMLLEDLEDLMNKSKKYRNFKIGFDDASIKAVESFYIDVQKGKEKIDVSLKRLDRIMIAYLGETLIERAGMGEWDFNQDKGTSGYGSPHIILYSKADHIPFNPVLQLDRLKEDLKPFLVENIQYHSNLEQDDEDFFKEFE
jgi:hypothetical protein